jgi:hypothetical protein
MNIEAERAQDPDAADAEDDLLLEPVNGIAAIEVMGQRAIVLAVLVKLSVE